MDFCYRYHLQNNRKDNDGTVPGHHDRRRADPVFENPGSEQGDGLSQCDREPSTDARAALYPYLSAAAVSAGSGRKMGRRKDEFIGLIVAKTQKIRYNHGQVNPGLTSVMSRKGMTR